MVRLACVREGEAILDWKGKTAGVLKLIDGSQVEVEPGDRVIGPVDGNVLRPRAVVKR